MNNKKRFFRFAEILAYIVEFLFIFAAILFVIGIFALLSGHSSHFLLTIDRRFLPINKVPTTLLWIISGVSLIGMVSFCMIVDSMRHLIHYLAEGRYFVRENLELIKKIMHFFAIVTLMELVVSILTTSINFNQFHSMSFEFSNFVADLVILGAIYLIYLVFKHGLQLQDDVDQIV